MAHHGKILKKAIEKAGLTQEEAAKKMGYATRQAFTALYQKEEFKETQLEKIADAFGFKREIFFPEPAQKLAPQAPEQACWQLLAEARQQIIDLQQQIIRMSTPNINAPKVAETA